VRQAAGVAVGEARRTVALARASCRSSTTTLPTLEPAARHGDCPLTGRGDAKWVANLRLWLSDDVLQLLLRDATAAGG
jgi:hypothetical protein